MTDTEAIKRIKKGRVNDFAILVERYHHRLLLFLYRMVGDSHLAEDIGQEVFFRIYKSLTDFDEDRGTPFSAWLYITARNAAISEMRKRKILSGYTIADIEDGGPSLEQQAIRNEELEILRDTLTQLPTPYQEALVKSLQGAEIAEIARLESISVGTVKSRIHRPKKLLGTLVKTHLKRIKNERV